MVTRGQSSRHPPPPPPPPFTRPEAKAAALERRRLWTKGGDEGLTRATLLSYNKRLEKRREEGGWLAGIVCQSTLHM